MTCIYIFAFGEYNSKQVNVSGILIFCAQFLALNLRKVMLNAANSYLFGIILTICKYIYRSFECPQTTPFCQKTSKSNRKLKAKGTLQAASLLLLLRLHIWKLIIYFKNNTQVCLKLRMFKYFLPLPNVLKTWFWDV